LPQRAAGRARDSNSAPKTEALAFLRAKLVAPAERGGLVERPRVVERLERSRRSRFVTVIAPLGYGKTTLLAQWAARDARDFAWLSLDHRDNDPIVLLSYVAQALNADGSVDDKVFKALQAPGDSLWSRGLPELGEALASREQPVVLVLDDVHALHDDRCLDALAALAGHVPPGSQIVFSGRHDPRIGLAKLRVDGELHELDAASLALNDDEAAALLAAAGADVTPTEASELNRHAEGWAAGLYLAALSLKGGSSVASFDGSDRLVTDYLRSEELSQTDEGARDFLLRTSVLETMTGTLCDAVLEQDDSAPMLEWLERENLFVVALDNTRTWFRYHNLFREMLLAELEREQAHVLPELRSRAADWFEANGWQEEAIDYAAATGDTARYARLVVRNAFPYYRAGRVTTVERWLAPLDDQELLTANPEIAVVGAWLHALRGRPAQSERWALALESADRSGTMYDGSSLEAWAATVRASLCRDGIDQMQRDAEIAVAGLTPASPWRQSAMLLAGLAALLRADDRAEALIEEAAEAAVAAGAVWVGLVARSQLALLALERGDLVAADAQTAVAREFTDESPSGDYVLSVIDHAVTARLAIAQGKGARARQALAAAQRLRPMLTHALPWLSVQAQLELAAAHLELGDPRGATTLYHEAQEILRRRPRLGTLVARAEEIGSRIPETPDASSGWAATLTAAELRLLPLLTTHLSFREIAERLFVSRNTVKTQAISIYRKLDASSRSEAIERAVTLGLVDAAPASRAADFTPTG
jgi:LuxR family transcriptional regulator, maltose regulon positive regulatory protein